MLAQQRAPRGHTVRRWTAADGVPALQSWVLVVCDQHRDWSRAVPAFVTRISSSGSYQKTRVTVLVPSRLSLLSNFGGPFFQELRDLKLSLIRPDQGNDQTQLKQAFLKAFREQQDCEQSRLIQVTCHDHKILGTTLAGEELFHIGGVNPSMLISIVRDRIAAMLKARPSAIILFEGDNLLCDYEAIGQRESLVLKQKIVAVQNCTSVASNPETDSSPCLDGNIRDDASRSVALQRDGGHADKCIGTQAPCASTTIADRSGAQDCEAVADMWDQQSPTLSATEPPLAQTPKRKRPISTMSSCADVTPLKSKPMAKQSIMPERNGEHAMALIEKRV
eukprot:TRINITY_DN102412_c0_g1_i1.p1 TRINITY_DN102412_c0_g1~~TRINITY_DN102412_c0_g1_i1.p1  ORF type:complete len:335 (-),score=33.92 TRINITY_DN102412_c0_g1_i1:387-1391(-)